MATRTDVYRIISKASLSGLNAATKAIRKHSVAIATMGKVASGAVRGIGSLARGLATLAAGGLLVVVALLRGLPGAFDAMREAVEGADDAVSGAGSSLEDTAEAASEAAEQMGNTADAAVEAAVKIEGAFGAIGKVGEGFIQTQGKMFERTEQLAKNAIDTAQDASEAMEDYQDAVGGAVESTSRFGKALDRIGSAWDKAKTKILQAIAKALIPALEALADLMESPAFEAFVDLMAKDMARAAKILANWFIKKVIPAIEDFMEKVEEAGGPIELMKEKWSEMKATALVVLGIIVGEVLIASNKIRGFFIGLFDTLKLAWLGWRLAFLHILKGATEAAGILVLAWVEFVKGAFNVVLSAIEIAVNAAIRVINPFLALFNAVAEATGGRKFDPLGKVTLPRLQQGGIISSPIAAIVGDAPSPEVIAPLDDLVDILRSLNIGGPSIGTVQVVVNADPGGLPLDQAGGVAADSFIREMRARGIQFAAR